MAVKFRGQATWDPTLIILQIATVQLLSYSSLALLLVLACEASGYSPSTVYIFQHEEINSTRLIILAHCINSFVSAFLIKTFVERSKLCLDFSLTYTVIHFILVWYYSKSIPTSFLWYFTYATITTVMCLTSEFLCRHEEIKSVPI